MSDWTKVFDNPNFSFQNPADLRRLATAMLEAADAEEARAHVAKTREATA